MELSSSVKWRWLSGLLALSGLAVASESGILDGSAEGRTRAETCQRALLDATKHNFTRASLPAYRETEKRCDCDKAAEKDSMGDEQWSCTGFVSWEMRR